MTKEPSPIEVTHRDAGWFVKRGELEWGPSSFLPSHIDDAFKEIAEALQIPEEEHNNLAKALWKSKITVQEQATAITRDGKDSQADRLVKLCLAQPDIVLFHDQTKTPYVRVRNNDALVTMPINSRTFKSWLSNLMWTEEEKTPGTEGIMGALRTLQGMALFQGEEHHLYNHVAPAPDGVWIDMCDDRWRAIKVTADGWHIEEDPPYLIQALQPPEAASRAAEGRGPLSLPRICEYSNGG